MPDARQAGWLRRCLAACVAGAFVALGAAGCASNGAAKAADPARVQRLGALFVQTMPIGWIAERVAQLDPQWPMQQHAGTFTPALNASRCRGWLPRCQQPSASARTRLNGA